MPFTPPAGNGPWNVIVVADDNGMGVGTSSECNEANNQATLAVTCAGIN